MGMDLYEITLEIEETFAIEVSNEEIEGLVRERDIVVGDLYEMILRKLHLQDLARYDFRMNYDLWIEMQRVLQVVTGTRLDDIRERYVIIRVGASCMLG